MRKPLLSFLLWLASVLVPALSTADVVKPALIEISVYDDETLIVEIRASIEALLTGINSRYKNTQDAPNAEAYDALRVLEPEPLRAAFKKFEQKFLDNIQLKLDGKPITLQIQAVDIPLPGYTKVPRISTITLQGHIPRSTRNLIWYYPEAFGDNAVRVRQVDRSEEKWHWSSWQWLRNDKPSEQFSLTEVFSRITLWEIIKTYVQSGFEHILPKGLDHILFILGLFLFSTRLKSLLWQVTMFTLAHTITLGLAMNNIINVPAAIVEPLIALSIAYVAIENILFHHLNKGRLIIVFIFGLLHGLGFASVLSDFGMPKDDFISALISFNIGVELGQLSVIAAAYLLLSHWFKDRQQYRRWVVIPGSAIIALVGLYWAVDRFDYGAINEIFT